MMLVGCPICGEYRLKPFGTESDGYRCLMSRRIYGKETRIHMLMQCIDIVGAPPEELMPEVQRWLNAEPFTPSMIPNFMRLLEYSGGPD